MRKSRLKYFMDEVTNGNEEEAKKLLKNEKKKRDREENKYCLEYYIKRGYSEEEANIEVSNFRDTCQRSRFGYWLLQANGNEEEAKILFQNFKKLVSKWSVEYWLNKGYSEEEAKYEVFKVQSKNGLKFSEKRKINPDLYIGSVPTTIEYFLKKTNGNEEEAKNLLKERQATNSLKNFIKRADGNIEIGIKNWQDRQYRWQATLNAKPLKERLEINRKRVAHMFVDGHQKSISEPERILKYILKCESQIHIDKYYYDLYKDNKIIEFNGDFWHCNPKKYEPTFFNKRTGVFASIQWEHDKVKNTIAQNNGYKVLVIWEMDWKKCPEQVIDKCREFLYGDKNARY